MLGAIHRHPMIERQSQIDTECRFRIAVVDEPAGRDQAVGHYHDRAVASYQPGGAPSDLVDAADETRRGLHPVADAIRVIEIQGDAREHVADDVAQSEANDGNEDARRSDEARRLLLEDEDENGDRGEDEHNAMQQIAEKARVLGRARRRERGAVEQKIEEPRAEPRDGKPGDHAGYITGSADEREVGCVAANIIRA